MSLVTRCPACATQFKVVSDQLKLSAGWVRCGHCSDVFDATRYLENWANGNGGPAASGKQQPLPHGPQGMPASQQALHSQSADVEPFDPSPQSPAALDADAIDFDLSLDEPDLPFSTSDFHTELKQFAATLGKSEGEPKRGPAGPAVPMPALAPPKLSSPLKAAATAAPAGSEPQEDATLEPGFMRQARRRAFWRSPGTRALLALVALALSALLAAQWALQERDRLAATHPDWQPLLIALCEPLGCSLGAVRDLQAVVIDSSTLARRIGDFYSFDLVLKNNASIPLAVPALELSLTDTADAVISRRVFLPEELPGVPALLPPSSTVPVSLRLSLAAGSDLPMAGYRALVFYP